MHYDKPIILETTTFKQCQLNSDLSEAFAVIWLHGLGADGHDFEAVVPMLNVEELPIRFIFPHAPVQPVTINGGMAMRSWYDIIGLEIDSRADVDGIHQSVAYTKNLIQQQCDNGMDSKHIIVAGFSQGGAVALHTGLTSELPLGGIMALSTYLPCSELINEENRQVNAEIDIFQAHGTQDPVVPIQLGEMAHHQLQLWNYPAKWHTYSMPHAVIEQELHAISHWLNHIVMSSGQ